MASGNCENCVNYKYEEDYDCYICDMDLDEDEMVRFLSASFENCPYFQLEDCAKANVAEAEELWKRQKKNPR